MARVTPKKLRDYILEHVDKSNPVHVEIAERYAEIYSQMRKAERQVNREGLTLTTTNGSQEFTKINPAQEIWDTKNKQLNEYFEKHLKPVMLSYSDGDSSSIKTVKNQSKPSSKIELFRAKAT